MTIRRTHLLFFLAFFMLGGWLPAQSYTVQISGQITDLSSQPLAGHSVSIYSDSTLSGFQYYNTVQTNPNGVYSDNVVVPNSVANGLLLIYTNNCSTQVLIDSVAFSSNANNFPNLDAQICTNPAGSCSAQFTATPDTSIPFGFVFLDASTAANTITSWSWDFGDSNFSSSSNPMHTYANSGAYEVCLTITDASNCSSTYCDTILVGGGNAANCQADFNYLNSAGTVSFYDSSSSSTSSIIAWSWDFGDGNSSSSASPTHTYASGTWTACLTIYTADSCVSTTCQNIVVSGGGGGVMCNASWYAIPDSTGQYTLLVVNTSTGNNLQYAWTFGDGSTSNAQYPTHQYNGPGVYLLCLTISDTSNPAGCTSTFCDSVAVFQKVNAPFSIQVVSPLTASPTPDPIAQMEAQFYPQPVGNVAHLKLELAQASDVTVKWFNLQGRMVKVEQLGDHPGGIQTYDINTNSLDSGMYLIRLETGLGEISKKVMLQR